MSLFEDLEEEIGSEFSTELQRIVESGYCDTSGLEQIIERIRLYETDDELDFYEAISLESDIENYIEELYKFEKDSEKEY